MKRINLSKVLSIFGLFILALSFFGLGLWQWDRAQENRKPIVVSKELVSLEKIAQPRSSLTAKAFLRNVTISGRYIAIFKAPNQSDVHGKVSAWEVGLLQTNSGSAILVVRGLWSDRNVLPINSQDLLLITGSLMPHQNEDHAESAKGIIQRLDSSVIVSATKDDLYDGYIVAKKEKVNGIELERIRIAPPTPKSAVPGFYWQHISYVIIWWFMSALVLYLPFYQRRVSQEQGEKVGDL